MPQVGSDPTERIALCSRRYGCRTPPPQMKGEALNATRESLRVAAGDYLDGVHAYIDKFAATRNWRDVIAKLEAQDKTDLTKVTGDVHNAYPCLFRAIVIDSWKSERAAARDLAARLDQRVKGLEERIRAYHHAFVIEKSIDSGGDREMAERTRAELAVAKIERSEAQIEEADVEGVVAFAEHGIGNVSALWTNASSEDRLALQSAFFPNGLIGNGAGFGTATTCLAFMQLRPAEPSEMGWRPHRVPEPCYQVSGCRFRVRST